MTTRGGRYSRRRFLMMGAGVTSGLVAAALVGCTEEEPEGTLTPTTEATATGRPVHVLSLPGGRRRMRDFHARLNRLGCTRPFEGNLPVWTYPPLDDTGNVAAAVATLLARRPAA